MTKRMPSRQALVQTEAQGTGEGSRKPCYIAPKDKLVMCLTVSEHQQFLETFS